MAECQTIARMYRMQKALQEIKFMGLENPQESQNGVHMKYVTLRAGIFLPVPEAIRKTCLKYVTRPMAENSILGPP